MKFASALCAALLLLSACGQAGPLVLPDAKPPAQNEPEKKQDQ